MRKKNTKSGRSKTSRSVLFFGDLHIGSTTAVCSPEPIKKEQKTVHVPNDIQKQLYDSWLWVQDSIIQKPHIIALNGDLTDGPNKKQGGMQTWSNNWQDQVNDAYKLLKSYNPNHFVMTRGSSYHVNEGPVNFEEQLAEKLNCVPYSDYAYKGEDVILDRDNNRHLANRTDYFLTLKVHDRIFSITHHVGFSKFQQYRTTQIAAELANMKFLEGKYWDAQYVPSIVVRSHVHYYVHVAFSQTYAFTNPCFKMPDSYLFKGGLGGTAPSIGAVEVIVEPNNEVLVKPHVIEDKQYPKHSILDLTD